MGLTIGFPRPQDSWRVSPFREWLRPNNELWAQFFRTSLGYMVRFPAMADFEVPFQGDDIKCWPAEGTSEELIQHLYLNQVVPLAFSRSGDLVFHASAVAIYESCVAFVGSAGRGKSTLAASFAIAGMPFLADDKLAVVRKGDLRLALPGNPSIRLWQDSEFALASETAPAAAAPVTKASLLAGAGFAFCNKPLPLRSVFLLGDGVADSISIQRLTSRAALMGLVRNSFLLATDEREMLARHFDELTAIANRPIHYQLDYPRRYSDLPSVRQAIIRHCAQE